MNNMSSYFEWLTSDLNTLYFFITLFLLGAIVWVILEIVIFVSETIEKNKKLEEIEKELKKLRKNVKKKDRN